MAFVERRRSGDLRPVRSLALLLVGGAHGRARAPARAAAPAADRSRSRPARGLAVRAETAGDTAGRGPRARGDPAAAGGAQRRHGDTVGLGMVLRGMERLDKGERASAEEAFRNAVAIAPGLPDAHFALARALLRKGPLGVPASINATLGGATAFRKTGARRAERAAPADTIGWLLFAFAVSPGRVGIALLSRKGGLLRHDLEEWLGPARRRSAARAAAGAAAAAGGELPGLGMAAAVVARAALRVSGQGERAVAAVLAARRPQPSGPTASSLDARLRTANNPLYSAALAAVEGVPDRGRARAPRAGGAGRPAGPGPGVPARVRRASAPATTTRRPSTTAGCSRPIRPMPSRATTWPGSSSRAAPTTRRSSATRPARSRAADPEVAATSYYNQSIAHLQKFEYEAFNEAQVERGPAGARARRGVRRLEVRHR